MNPVHVHLMLNHVPVVGVPAGLALLEWGVLKGSEDLKDAGLAAFVLSAAAAAAAAVSGLLSEPIALALAAPSGLIERHEDAAALAASLAGGLGVVAAWMLARRRRGRSVPERLWTALALGALAAAAFLSRAAFLGGQVRHWELQPDWKAYRSAPPQP